MMQKKTQGRKKIEIKRIADENRRQVTFSKRRTGLFNKASELCVLTGAEAAIITQSPGGRVFAFGHPSVDSVVDKYLAGSSKNIAVNEVNSIPTSMQENFNQKYKEISKEIEDEKKKNVLEEKLEDNPNFWWEESFEHLGIEELEKYIASMEQLKDNLTMRVDEMAMLRNSSKFDMNQSAKNEGSVVFQLNDQKTDGGGSSVGGTNQMLPYPHGFNFGSG
ncbi:Agamous-like MADS-box protein AGL62 [Heracleum sosnowskyi]|uniref:Agamous-like MADS-box protein AGL62 n=1 Tax=Heracleum sosnowskyi TaxID=360622 RepID=A0AAD8HRB8_9APIA|nr:Agamous-like MADS-box protein AGL62 [Heracleum sosnowskyi]